MYLFKKLAFLLCPGWNLYGVVLYSHNLWGNLWGVFDVLQMKEEDINSLQQQPTWVVPTLISRRAHLQIGSEAIYTINLKKTPEKHCWKAMLKFVTATGTTPITLCFTPGPSLTRSRNVFQWWLTQCEPPTFHRGILTCVLVVNFHIVLTKYLKETTSGEIIYFGS